MRVAVPSRHRGGLATAALLGATIAACLAGGCANKPPKPEATATQLRRLPTAEGPIRAELNSLADTYTTIAIQGLDEVLATSKREDVIAWAKADRFAVAMAAFTNACSVSPAAGLLDMMVYARLKRLAIVEHWGPNLLKEEVGPVLRAYVRAETEAMAVAKRNLSEQQCNELIEVVDAWRRDHPGQYYVSHIRFSEFARYRGITVNSPQAKLPNSVFGLLYMDPLAGIDPIAREMHEFRMLMERMSFMTTRLPHLLSWQVADIAQQTASTPELRRFVKGTEDFAGGTVEIGKAVSEIGKATSALPANLAVERKAALEQTAALLAVERNAAINQLSEQMTQQRKGISEDLDKQTANLNAVIKEAGGLLDRGESIATTVTTSTSDTLARTQQAAESTIDRIFVWVLIVIVVLLVGIPLSAMANRRARQRQARARAVHPSPKAAEHVSV